MNTTDVIAVIVDEWFQGLPTPTEQLQGHGGLIDDLTRQVEHIERRAALAERVRIVAEIRTFAEHVRHESSSRSTRIALGGIVDEVANRINVLPDN